MDRTDEADAVAITRHMPKPTPGIEPDTAQTEVITMTTNSRLRSGSVTAPETGISIYQAIHDRRMNNDFSDHVPDRDVLQRMLDAAVWRRTIA